MTKITSPQMLGEIKAAYERGQAAYERRVLVCGGAGCVSCHCQAVREALEEAVETLGLRQRVKVMVTGCIGLCAAGPVMVVEPDGVLYTSLDAERAAGFRRRAASDGTGVLLAQLNPGGDSAPARVEQSAEHGPERAGGRVDEQR